MLKYVLPNLLSVKIHNKSKENKQLFN